MEEDGPEASEALASQASLLERAELHAVRQATVSTTRLARWKLYAPSGIATFFCVVMVAARGILGMMFATPRTRFLMDQDSARRLRAEHTCACSGEFDTKWHQIDGNFGAYCKHWDSDYHGVWCFAENCPDLVLGSSKYYGQDLSWSQAACVFHGDVDGYQGRHLVAQQGPTLRMYTAQTLISCAHYCDQIAGCNSFTFGIISPHVRECYLKSQVVTVSSQNTSDAMSAEQFRTYYKAPLPPDSLPDSLSHFLMPALGGTVVLVASLAAVCCCLRTRKQGQGEGERVFTADQQPQSKALDPSWAAISLEQLADLRKAACQHFGSGYSQVNMHHVVAELVRPLCAEHDKCYAHIVNGENLLHVTVFISHCWSENFEMFTKSIFTTFCQWTVKPNIWICATALFQTTDHAKIAQQVGTGNDPRKAPFSTALRQAEKILIVRNEEVDLYSRIWCCWELFCAYELGLVERPGFLMVAGPTPASPLPSSDEPAVDIVNADASNPQDKRMILSCVVSSGLDIQDINMKLTQIKYHDFAG